MTMAKSVTKPTESKRGSNFGVDFCENFKKSKFYEVYKRHTDELFIGVRDGYINIYYNCASIAKIRCGKRGIVKNAEINDYYLKKDSQKKNKYVFISEDDFVKHYEHIKIRSDAKVNLEKKSQERLVIDNNTNQNSNWYCLDVEYMKSIDGKLKLWRFDIIAISKESPHRVALIELKYGSDAIGGESGIQKHIKDYETFLDEDGFGKYLKSEIVDILKMQVDLGVDVPKEFVGIKEQDILDIPKIYVITLNNKSSIDGSTPKMTMGGYLFKNKTKWMSKKVADNVINVKNKKYYDFEKAIEKIKPTFLFSESKLMVSGRLKKTINDILNEKNYEDVEQF